MTSNIDNPVAYLNQLRDIEAGLDEPEPHQVDSETRVQIDIANGFQLADDIYRAAMDAKPKEIADKLLDIAHSESRAETRATLRTAAVMLLQFSVTSEHAQAVQNRFGAT